MRGEFGPGTVFTVLAGAAGRLDAGDRRFEGRALVVAFVNGRQDGGGAVVAPGAGLDDGLLDVVVIEDAPRFEMAWNSTRLFLGDIERFRRYRHFPARRAVLEGTGTFVHHRDGEPEGEAARLEVSVQPLALAILVPARTAEDPRGPFAALQSPHHGNQPRPHPGGLAGSAP